jgi:hypothetical protein
MFQHPFQPFAQGGAEPRLLRCQIKKRNLHHAAS